MFPVGMLSIAPQLNIDENLAQDLSLLQFPPEVEPVVSGASICWGVICVSSLKMIFTFSDETSAVSLLTILEHHYICAQRNWES